MAGRKRIEFTDDQKKEMEELARIQCTQEEIADYFGCSVDTLHRHFAEFLKRGKNRGRIKIRKKQFDLAVQGNVTMLVWLGKQFLGQQEKPDVSKEISEMSDDEILVKLQESTSIIERRIAEKKTK